jgi:hypothetical protein
MADKESPYASIAISIGGISLAMIVVILILAQDDAWLVAPVVVSMALLGIVLGYFSHKKK